MKAPKKTFDINRGLKVKWGDKAWYRFICITESGSNSSQDKFWDYVDSTEYSDCLFRTLNQNTGRNGFFGGKMGVNLGSAPNFNEGMTQHLTFVPVGALQPSRLSQ